MESSRAEVSIRMYGTGMSHSTQKLSMEGVLHGTVCTVFAETNASHQHLVRPREQKFVGGLPSVTSSMAR